MSKDVLKKVSEAIEAGRRVALATVTYSEGSSPGIVGSMMAIFVGGAMCGTIGGGAVEHAVASRAMEALISGESFEFDHELNAGGTLGMACGGRMRGFVNVIRPNKRLVLFGGGHVCQSIARLTAELPFDVYVIDDRRELGASFPNAKRYYDCPIEEAAAHITWDEDTFVVIATRGHGLDFEALMCVIGRPSAYVGLMGSRAKVSEIKARLNEKGIAREKADDIYMPIGLDISNGTPAEIAVSVLGEILAVKNGKPNGFKSRS